MILFKWMKKTAKNCKCNAANLSCHVIEKMLESAEFIFTLNKKPHKYRVTHLRNSFFKGLKMSEKQYVHMKIRQHPFKKDPPFAINHQLTSADSFLAVDIDLKSKYWFFFFFQLLSFFKKCIVSKLLYYYSNINKHLLLRNLLFWDSLGSKKQIFQRISK